MAQNAIKGFIGPTGVGWGYGVVLDAVLSSPDLSEAVVASAYLTIEAAEQLVATIYGRTVKRVKPKVTILVGTKDRFTRKAAIQRLLPHARGGREAKACPVELAVLCPEEPHFHVKATYARRKGRHQAVLGSHNLTGAGLDSAAELGVFIEGKPAQQVFRALSRWLNASTPWEKVVKTYKEAKLSPSKDAWSGRKSGTRESNVAFVGSDFEGDVPLSKMDEKIRSEGIQRFRKSAPALAKRADIYLLLEDTRENALDEWGYFRGSLFSHSEDYPGEAWRIGQNRAVLRVLDTVRVNRGKACVVVAERVKKFKVTDGIRRAADTLGMISDLPEPVDLARFLTFLRTGTLPGTMAARRTTSKAA